MGNIAYFRQNVAQFAQNEGKLTGKIKGMAYSGGIIKQHGPFSNLIIDLESTTIAKEKTPIFRDHNPSQVAGFGKLTIEDGIPLEGQLSLKSQFGKEALELAEDGFDWELSIGIFDFDIQDITNEVVNGIKVEKGVVFRNGVIREVSLVSLGADMNTKAEVFNYKKGDEPMKVELSKDQWDKILLACGCGGDLKPEQLAEEIEEKGKEKEDELAALKKEIADLKAKLAEKEEEEAKKKEEEELSARVTSIEKALEEKQAQFSKEKIQEAAKSKEATELLLSFIGEMKVEKKIKEGFEKNLDLSKEIKKDDAEALRLAAEAMVKEGKATDFITALNMLEGK